MHFCNVVDQKPGTKVYVFLVRVLNVHKHSIHPSKKRRDDDDDKPRREIFADFPHLRTYPGPG